MPSLWLNGVFLGQILEPPHGTQDDGAGAISGRLKPTPAFASMQPMMQTRLAIMPGSPTFQHVLKRTVIGAPPRRNSGQLKELTEMSPEKGHRSGEAPQ